MSHVTEQVYRRPIPAAVLELYGRDGGPDLCRQRWSESFKTPDLLRKFIMEARSGQGRVANPSHPRRASRAREDEIVAAVIKAGCVSHGARHVGCSDLLVYRIFRERGLTAPTLTSDEKSARFKAAHRRRQGDRAPVQLELF